MYTESSWMGCSALSVDRTILATPIATPLQRERLRDAALGGALTSRRTLQNLIAILALLGTYSLLIFREVALVNSLEAGRRLPPGFTVTEPSEVAWQTIDLPASGGLPVSLAWDATRSEFQLTLDSGEFVRLKPGRPEPVVQQLPFLPGPDLPVLLQPGLTRCHWPGTDGKRAFFLSAENQMVTVDAATLKVLSSQPALPESGAPRRFSTPYPLWHVAYDTRSDRLVVVVRDRTEGQVLSFFQFEEPKRGFGTLQHFAVDGPRGTVSYTVDGVPGFRQLRVGDDGVLENTGYTLPPAPFPAGSSAPEAVWSLPLRRLQQFQYGEVGTLAQVQGGLTAALRQEAPMVSLIGPDEPTQRAGYFPGFASMPPNGVLPTAKGIVLVGSQEAGDTLTEMGVEVLDFEAKSILRTSDFGRGAIRVPAEANTLPLLATSPDGRYVALTTPHAAQVWLAEIIPQQAEAGILTPPES